MQYTCRLLGSRTMEEHKEHTNKKGGWSELVKFCCENAWAHSTAEGDANSKQTNKQKFKVRQPQRAAKSKRPNAPSEGSKNNGIKDISAWEKCGCCKTLLLLLLACSLSNQMACKSTV